MEWNMYQIERIEKILEYINAHKKAKIDELSEIFNTSKVTIRNDINELAQKGLVVKTHGGVLSIQNRFSLEIPSTRKFELNIEAKRKIGALATSLINDDDIVILDAGSTTLEVAKHIKKNNVTVITNDIKIGMEVANQSKNKLIMPGGTLEPSVYTLLGDDTANFFSKVHVNKLFLGCDAMDLELGITNRTFHEVSVKQAMMRAAEEVIVVTDSTKLHQKVFAHVCSLFDIDKIIIDMMDDQTRQALQQGGVKVIITAERED
jgi:DeoR/GlpR family transcriptional regulator of sugar metabolism